MIEELRIRGLGVIDDAVLPLGPGLTVVTGETGAGKTMVVTGLLLLFGGRADVARVRTGAAQASVEGRLAVPPGAQVRERVADAGGEFDDGTDLILRRVVSASGRSRAFVGGAATPVATLGELADDLVAVHGQTDQLRLTRPGAQREALDRFAGLETTAFAAQFAQWRAADAELHDRLARAASLRREADLLTHGLAEIEALDPQPGELDELARRAARLGHADALKLAARTAHDAVLGNADDPLGDAADAATLLGAAVRTLTQQSGEDRELDELAARLAELQSLVVQAGSDLGAYADQLESDPEELDRTETRRAALNTLVRKYCDEPEPSLDGVLRWAEHARSELARIDVSDEAMDRLRARRDEAAAATAAQAAELTARRAEAAGRLAAAVTAELAGLAMADARLDITVSPRPVSSTGAALVVDGHEVGVTADGADEVEFLLAPHPGAPALALGRGASGGELSRVMLALEVSLAGTDLVPTLVFDEVDAGVGGRAAVEVGRRLARLARERQVLVVTHLAQVAGFADRHLVVDKPSTGGTEPGGVTASDVHLVEGVQRVGELARMLAGSDTPAAREHAAELLATAASERT